MTIGHVRIMGLDSSGKISSVSGTDLDGRNPIPQFSKLYNISFYGNPLMDLITNKDIADWDYGTFRYNNNLAWPAFNISKKRFSPYLVSISDDKSFSIRDEAERIRVLPSQLKTDSELTPNERKTSNNTGEVFWKSDETSQYFFEREAFFNQSKAPLPELARLLYFLLNREITTFDNSVDTSKTVNQLSRDLLERYPD